MGMFGRWAVRRLQQRATNDQRKFDACIRAGDLIGALRHSEDLQWAIDGLVARERGERIHRFFLAGVFYNRATVLDAVGRGEEAVAAARRSVELYEESDMIRGDPSFVQVLLAVTRPDATVTEPMIAQAADARARLARLLAKYHGKEPGQAAAVHRYGRAAVEIYEQLLRYGRETKQADLDRVREQYAAAKAHLR
jgi:hypothetical protein